MFVSTMISNNQKNQLMNLEFKVSEEKQQEIQDKVNASALKATMNAIEDYFDEYNSQYKAQIKEQLSKQDFGVKMDLPKVISLINQQLENQMTQIANTAVAQTFMPMVHRFLTNTEPIVLMSETLKKLISETSSEYGDFHFEYTENEKYGWLDCEIEYDGKNISFTLHKDRDYEKGKWIDTGYYKLGSLPYEKGVNNKEIRIVSETENGRKVELYLPFTPTVLENPIISYMSRVLLSGSKFTIDCDGVEEEWFYEND